MESKVIERVFVARRPLKGTGKLMKGVAAHSGLLLRTTDQGYYILEYLADSKAELYEIHLNVIESIEDPPHEIFLLGDFKWTKQMYGKPITDPKWTLGKAKERMNALMADGYKLGKGEVCHTAQERLRTEMGIYDGETTCNIM